MLETIQANGHGTIIYSIPMSIKKANIFPNLTFLLHQHQLQFSSTFIQTQHQLKAGQQHQIEKKSTSQLKMSRRDDVREFRQQIQDANRRGQMPERVRVQGQTLHRLAPGEPSRPGVEYRYTRSVRETSRRQGGGGPSGGQVFNEAAKEVAKGVAKGVGNKIAGSSVFDGVRELRRDVREGYGEIRRGELRRGAVCDSIRGNAGGNNRGRPGGGGAQAGRGGPPPGSGFMGAYMGRDGPPPGTGFMGSYMSGARR